MNNEDPDEMRRRIQEALSQAKRDKLHSEYGMEFEYTDSSLSPEVENEEMDDIRIEGMMTHFTYSTPEHDVQMWVKSFVLDLFTHEQEYFLPGLAKQPLFNRQGEPITAAQFQQAIEAVWQRLPLRVAALCLDS